MQFLWKWIDEFVGKGLEWSVLAKLMFYASTTFVPMALPLAILLSSIMVFGNLGENYELVAIKAAGISLRKAMKPLVILSILISIGAFLFSNYILPVANLKFGSLLYDIRKKKMTFNLSEGIFYYGLDNYVIRIDRKDKDDKTVYGVLIYNHTDHMGNNEVISAEKGIMELTPDKSKMVFTLYDGYDYREITDQRKYRVTRPFEYMKFKKQTMMFDLSDFSLNHTDEDLFRNHYSMLNIRQLNYAIDSLSKRFVSREKAFKENYLRRLRDNSLSKVITIDTMKKEKAEKLLKKVDKEYDFKDSLFMKNLALAHPALGEFTLDQKEKVLKKALRLSRSAKESAAYFSREAKSNKMYLTKHEVVWHQKFKLSIACLLFFFVGAPLGTIIRKGGLGMPIVMSVLIFVVYHIISMIGEKSVKTGEWNVVIGIWLSTLVILPVGLFLTWKATTDAPLLDYESWYKFFDKINFFKKLKNKRIND